MIVVTSNFDGIAWPAAQPDGFIDVRDTFGGATRRVIQLKTTGRGRRLQWDDTRAFWRNFASINIHDEDEVLRFVIRRGDPFGRLNADQSTDTGEWEELIHYLRPMAHAWDKEDDEGESHVVVDQEKKAAIFKYLMDWKEFNKLVTPMLYIDPFTSDLKTRLHASTLAGFMLATAMMQTQSRATLIRCAHCADWFAINRKAKFCSPSCRALYSTAQVRGRAHG